MALKHGLAFKQTSGFEIYFPIKTKISVTLQKSKKNISFILPPF